MDEEGVSFGTDSVEGTLEGMPSLGTLEDMLGKSLDAGFSLREERAHIPATWVGE